MSLTLGVFVQRMRRLSRQIETVDPCGADPALRLTVAYSLYASFDALRCQETPFDRRAFSERLRALEAMAAEYPRLPRAARGRSEIGCVPEAVVTELYSRCWSHYSDAEFQKTIDLFEERFRLNHITLDFLRGADCLDAGCGSGRYTMAMSQLGARRAVGIDISHRAIREARQRSRRLGFPPTVQFLQGSVIAMPMAWTDRFDFVCSNGVVHHTTNPTAGVWELFRVLKPGGLAYIYVYGTGGLGWAIVDVVRALVRRVPMSLADRWLQGLGLGPGKVFNYMDHWYVPLQERVSQTEFEARLQAAGFEGVTYMPRAVVYDSSERRHRFPEERDLVGEGDLRYLVTKPVRAAQRAVRREPAAAAV